MSQRWSNLVVWLVTIVGVVAVSKAAWSGQPVNGTSLLNLVVFALPLAGIYAMFASGLVVVYTTTGVFNFAQGGIGMFMAYVDWELTVHRGVPQAIALPLCVLVIAPILGVGLDRLIMRHVQGRPLVVQLMVTVGLMFAFIAVANTIWNQGESHSMPPLFANKGFDIGDVTLTWHRFITVVLAVLLAIGLRFLLFHTRLGIAMRAVVDNRDLAALEGARPAVLSSFAWALGCAVAALAGILIAPETADMSTSVLTLLIITAFSAAVVGRLRSLPLTYLGALILALAITYTQTFLVFNGRWTNVADTLPAIMLFIVLLLLPRASLQFSRINPVKRVERVSTVRDTAIGMAALVVFIFALSFFLSDRNLGRFSLGMCTALVALSLVPLTGWAGQVSLAPLAFAGIGAVAYTRLGGAHGSIWAVLLATLVTIPVGALLALPAMRLQGLYLALATFAFAATVEAIFYSQPWAVGDTNRAVKRVHLLGIDLSSPRAFLILITVVFGLAGIGVIALRRSPFGRRLIALRDSEAASATVGINILETKLAVFSLSAGMAGFAGAFLAMHYGQIQAGNPNPQFGVLLGLPIVLALVIGGVGFVAGALFAGLFGLVSIIVQENWHLSLWTQLTLLAPGLAVLAIIQNPSGAVVPIGEGFARLLPWRHDAREEYEALKAENAEPEVGELGLERGFEETDVLYIDRELGISDEVPRVFRWRGPDAMAVLDIVEVSVVFGGLTAVDAASFTVEAGCVTGLIGPNGAGKTTLFNVITGLQPPNGGRIQLDKRDITGKRPHRRARLGIARTFQRLEAFGSLSARENVLVALEIRRRWEKERFDTDAEALRLLEKVGIASVAERKVEMLPTGTARLVELARALATNPNVLLLDEPSSGLDETETDALGVLLHELAGDGLAVLLVEHDMPLVMDTCTFINVLDFGRIIARGNPHEIQSDPAVQRAYLGTAKAEAS